MNSSLIPAPAARSAHTRRQFLRASGSAFAGAALAGALGTPRPGYGAESSEVKVALVGCGGRGTGAAAQALATKTGPVKLWALADVFPGRLQGSLKGLADRFQQQVDVPPDRQFIGLDAFKRAIDTLGKTDVVLLATPAAFRPIHFEYAVQKGVNVFMEKSFAVDAPGIRRLIKAGEVATQKNLKVAGGLMWRHNLPRQEVIQRIHDGAIGELNLLRTYRMHGPVGFNPRQPGQSLMAHQIMNYSSFNWLNASFYVDWLIHNIDVCCWAKNDWPVSAQGMGGRQARTEPDEMWDHYLVEYTFKDGAKLFAQARHMNRCYDEFADYAHGSKGSAVIMESLAAPKSRLYQNNVMKPENEIWRFRGTAPDEYQVEHDRLIEAIRQDKPYNETDRCAKAVLASILGRMACYSGQLVTWQEALASNLELAPGLDQVTSLDAAPPVVPDASGHYPIPVPGLTKAL
jgi:myo-inositol 2-dehydrogenase / D-chiro-inositol 1-dehydrogenase